MKKIKVKGKLNLNKELITEMTNSEMTVMKGGFLSIGDKCKRKKRAKNNKWRW